MVNSIIQGSIVSATNMDPGFVITKVNNIRVTTIEEITSYLEKNKGEIILEGFYEGYKEKYFYTFRI
jgi:S1-C subfamily serine protease